MFIGVVTAGVPLGVTFSFLISAPMVNEIALVLLFGLFGWKIAALYLGTGLGIAMIAGWTIGRLGTEKHVEAWVYQAVGILPVVQALLAKGAALGTVLAFMMAVIGLSLPEMIILRKVLKVRLVATFSGVVGVGILIVGYLFNRIL